MQWRNAYLTGAWYRTEYEPLAAKEEVFPPTSSAVTNPAYDPNRANEWWDRKTVERTMAPGTFKESKP